VGQLPPLEGGAAEDEEKESPLQAQMDDEDQETIEKHEEIRQEVHVAQYEMQ